MALGRDGNALEPLVSAWYEATSGVEPGSDPRHRAPSDAPASLDQVLVLALRPFLARCAESLTPQVDLASWNHGHCPICGWEPDFAVITPEGTGACSAGAAWRSGGSRRSPARICTNDDRALITSFATRDGRYRVYACDVCRRYLKAYDARRAPAAGDGRGGHDRDAAARRGGDAARVRRVAGARPARRDYGIRDLG